MVFTHEELTYFSTQPLGRLATIAPDGQPQVSPVIFKYNLETQTIDITGFNLASSKKFRNITTNPRVAFVIDDLATIDPWRPRCVEIRGTAKALTPDSSNTLNEPLIRIHPTKIITFGIDNADVDAHEMKSYTRIIET